MYSWEKQIQFPFVYLDSSHIMRSGNSKIEQISRKFLKKYPQISKQILSQIELSSLKDNLYYEKLIRLKKQKKISYLITMEAFNPILIQDSIDTIFLFGKVFQNKFDHITFWGDEIDFKLYNTAAMLIANAECVIADADFFKLSIGKKLREYIPSRCAFMISASSTSLPKSDSDYIECDLPSKEMISYLFFLR